MGKPQCPGPEAYIEAERESVKSAPAPDVEHPGSIAIRWMTESNDEFGIFWSMEILTFEPNERIFDRKTYEDGQVYQSIDTRTYLDRDATCASVNLFGTPVS